MQVYVYDSEMAMLGLIERITSLVWTRKYWECGEFKLLVPFDTVHNELLQPGNLIIKHGDVEAAEIQYVSISKNLEGYEIIEAQGKFLTHWISKRVIVNQLKNVSATAQSHIQRIVRENCVSASAARVIPSLSMHTDDTIPGEDILYTSEEYENCLDAIEELAMGSKIGFKIVTDRVEGTHQFCVYKGVDCTADNTAGNPPCIFSQEYDNVLEQEYSISTEKHKTMAYVTGEEVDGVPIATVLVGDSLTGLDRKELYVSGSDIKKTYKNDAGQTITLTTAQYETALTDRGNEKLEQNPIIQNFTSEINVGANLIYREDFDLGDRVTCVNKTWNVRIDARITEVAEYYEAGKGDSLEITFGESIPSVYKQIKSMIK